MDLKLLNIKEYLFWKLKIPWTVIGVLIFFDEAMGLISIYVIVNHKFFINNI